MIGHTNKQTEITNYIYNMNNCVVYARVLLYIIYRVSHETRQFVNSFDRLILYTVYMLKAFCSIFRLKNLLLKYILFLYQFYHNMTVI